MKEIGGFGGNKITLDEVQRYFEIEEYIMLVEKVRGLIEENALNPIKSSGLNGKKPALYQKYRIIREKKDDNSFKDELRYMVPELCPDFYLLHMEQYEKDREYIRRLNDYMIKSRSNLNCAVSINERSFEIFGREKFLLKEGGIGLLKKLGLPFERLNSYETSQPLAYYSYKKEEGQTLLFIENKDTFYSMRKHMLEGNEKIMGTSVGTLIYGGGKAVYRSVSDFDRCIEPYMKSEKNTILYFGDLDYEGILIYEQLKNLMMPTYNVLPFTIAYQKMILKSESIVLPETKEQQNKNCGSEFLKYFDEDIIYKIKQILESGRYIPQEILQFSDF